MPRDDLATVDLRALVVRLRDEVRETLLVLGGPAGAAQYERSPVPALIDDTTERSKGGHGNPTQEIALDPKRLRLRAAIIAAERELETAVEKLVAARSSVERAFESWEG